MCRLIALICILVIFLNSVNCANILGLMGVASPSHHHFNSALMHELGKRGHNVTVLSVDLPKSTQSKLNVHYIHLENAYKNLYENAEHNLDITEFFGMSGVSGIKQFYTFTEETIPGIYSSKGFFDLLNYPDDFKFDAVIYDYSMGPFLLGYLEKFNYPPLIGISPFLNPPNTNDYAGVHLFPGYIPHYLTTFDVEMNFFERLENTILHSWDLIYRRFIFTPNLDKIFRPYYPKNTPYLGDLEKRTVLALVNSHPAVNYPESLPPNVVEVGGLQLTDPQPLPKEIDIFMNNSQNGAVLFSLGTNVNAANLKESRIQLILDVMAQLPQYNFLWKMDFDKPKFKISKNVLIKPLFPQRDILGHPKIKVFVTHSGGLSTQEAIWQGVPMVGLALFADQPRNLHKSFLNGIAAKVDYLTLTVDGLKDTIQMVAEDPSFAKNMKERSKLYRDQPMKPLERAVWWVEYVIRNPNAKHLISPALNMNFFVAHSLDVIAFLLITPIILIVIACKLIRCCFCSKTKTTKNYSNKKLE